jgi:Ulp1 family protease
MSNEEAKSTLDAFLHKFSNLSHSQRPKVNKICRFLEYQQKDLAIKTLLNVQNITQPFTLPQDWKTSVQSKIKAASDSSCIIIVGKCTIGQAELKRLEPGNWLNDQIVDGYLYLISEASFGTVHSFNCFFWQKIQRGDWAGLAAYTRRWMVKVWEKRLLLFPIAIANTHWALCAVDIKAKSIGYYDSLVSSGKEKCCPIPRLFENVMHFLQAEARENAVEMHAQEWKYHSANSALHQQENGNDCGVFLCVFAAYLAKEKKFDFSQEHMPYFRQKMIYELLHCTLID